MWELEGEVQVDRMRDILMFDLRHIETDEIKVCGVTRIALNDHFRTEDTIEQAEENFEQHREMIIELTAGLIERDAANDRGQYIVTSAILG